MSDLSNDQIRAAAGLAIQAMIRDKGDNVFTWAEIDRGFEIAGKKIHFATKAAGIFKPAELTDKAALSIRQARPSRTGRAIPYDDKELNDGVVIYQLQKEGQKSHFNAQLEAAYQRRLPLIFFRGLSDALYEAFYPVFIDEFSYQAGETRIIFDQPELPTEELGSGLAETTVRYSYSIKRNRLHQKAFRERVLMAYGLRCALTNLPLVDLLEAAHIIADSDGGSASVQNGIAMSTFHHTAFESNLMGIDPDGKIILSETVLGTRDGPMFSHGLLGLKDKTMRFPSYAGHRPNRDFLAEKYEAFLKADK